MRDHPVTRFERRRRDLPHWEEPGATYAMRFGLRRPSPIDLTIPPIGDVIVRTLRLYDGERYWLYDYTIMPDHVHMILKPIVCDGRTEHLWRITQSIKGYTGRRINELLRLAGPVWQRETYDHLIRNRADYEACAQYILHNPVAAGLIADPTRWPWWGKGCGL